MVLYTHNVLQLSRKRRKNDPFNQDKTYDYYLEVFTFNAAMLVIYVNLYGLLFEIQLYLIHGGNCIV